MGFVAFLINNKYFFINFCIKNFSLIQICLQFTIVYHVPKDGFIESVKLLTTEA